MKLGLEVLGDMCEASALSSCWNDPAKGDEESVDELMLLGFCGSCLGSVGLYHKQL